MSADGFDAHRDMLFGLAYRMLGSVSEAEDAVQECWLRWQAAAPPDNPGAWLRAVMTRLCVDQLRSARVRRVRYVGPWLPEPLAVDAPPDEALAGSLSTAFLLLLERLSPAERAAFLLREVFGRDYGEVAQALGRSEAACRQLVRRARVHLEQGGGRYTVDQDEQERVFAQFLAACASGDVASLAAVLAPDAVALSDGGGQVRAARRPVVGGAKVATFLSHLVKGGAAGQEVRLVRLNGQPAVLTLDPGGQVRSALTLAISAGLVTRVFLVLSPDKLAGLHAAPYSSR